MYNQSVIRLISMCFQCLFKMYSCTLGYLADYITCVGVADDVPSFACLAAIPKFKKKVCTVCGKVIYGL